MSGHRWLAFDLRWHLVYRTTDKRGSQNLRKRIRYRFRGNAEGSTLRPTLGCLLADQLGIKLRRVGSGERLTLKSGEDRLSAWMAENALVLTFRVRLPGSLRRR